MSIAGKKVVTKIDGASRIPIEYFSEDYQRRVRRALGYILAALADKGAVVRSLYKITEQNLRYLSFLYAAIATNDEQLHVMLAGSRIEIIESKIRIEQISVYRQGYYLRFDLYGSTTYLVAGRLAEIELRLRDNYSKTFEAYRRKFRRELGLYAAISKL
jgi:hypothetical protein